MQMIGSSKTLKKFWKNLENLLIENDLQKRKKLTKKQYILVQIVVTRVSMEEMLVLLQEPCGHFGYKKTFQRIQERFYLPGISRFNKGWVNSCEKCIAKKKEAKPSILADSVGYHGTTTGITRIQVYSSNRR